MASRYWVGGTGTWDNSATTHWSATTGGAGGSSVPGASDTVTFDASSGGGTVTLGYNPTVVSITMGAFTGTFDGSTQNPTMGTFSNTGSGVRTLTMGSGTWTLTTGGTNAWNMNTVTNLTMSATTAIINMTGASADFEGGGQTFGTLNFTGGGNMKIGFSNTFAALSVIGTAVTTDSFSSGGGTNTVTGTFTITGNSGVNTIAVKSDTTASVRNFVFGNGAFSNIASWTDVSLNMNGAGNTWTLSEDLILGGTGTTMTLTITAGTIIAGTKNVSAKLFNSSNSNVRTLTMGSGTWTLTGTGTVWTTATATNLSSDMSTGKLVISDVSSSSKTISAAASASFGTITTTAGGTGAVIFPSNNVTVSTLNVTGPKTLTFTSAKTYTITNWNVNGTYGNPVTINASTPGSAATISIAKGTISSDFLSVKDSTATGGATFYAGSHSTNALGNNGWIFDDAPLTASENAAIDNNSNPTMLGSVTTDPTKTAKLYSDPYVHSLVVSDSTGGTGYGGTSAPRDGNQNTAILAVSSADGVSPVAIYINPNLHELLINSN